MTSRKGDHHGRPRFRSTGGLLFVTAALSSLLVLSLPSATTAWTSPLFGSRTTHQHQQRSPVANHVITSAGIIDAKTTALSMSSNTASQPEHQPLAKEGDWVAYLDTNYGRVYYFNHDTGETSWEPPTNTFPVPNAATGNGGNSENMNDMTDMNDPRNMRENQEQGQQRQGQPQQQQPGQPQQQGQGQQQGQDTFYEILQVPPTATRPQIKASYLSLTKLYDSRMDGGKRSSQYAQIARAWMVLSDARLRDRYDLQLEQWEREKRMRSKMMEEERMWMVDQAQLEEMELEEMELQSGDVRDEYNYRQQQQKEKQQQGQGNKFVKDVVYKKKMEVLDDDGTNKFGRFRQQQSMGSNQQRDMMDQQDMMGDQQGFGARSLEIDEEAEIMQQQHEMQMQEQQQMQMQQQAQNEADYMAMEAERAELIRQKQEAQAQLAQEQAQQQAQQRQVQMAEERKREEQRRAGSERHVIQDRPKGPGQAGQMPQQTAGQPMQPQQPGGQQQPVSGTDMNAMMANMKQKFGQKKMDEAARVQDELTKLQGMGGNNVSATQPASSTGQPNGNAAEQQTEKRTGVLFPGKGGVVAEDSPFVAKDLLLDDYLGRGPSFVSWVPPENEGKGEASDVGSQAASPNVQDPPVGSGGMGSTASSGPSGPGGQGVAPTSTISGEREREQERLQNIKSRPIKNMGRGKQQQPDVGVGGNNGGNFGNPMKTSSTAREQERLQGMKAKANPMATNPMAGGYGIGNSRGGPQTVGPSTPVRPERATLGTDRPMKSSSKEREQQRLMGMKAKAVMAGSGIGGMGQPATGVPPKPTANNIDQLKEAHRTELSKLKSQMEKSAAKTLEDEIVQIAKIHAGEITKLKDNFEASQAEAMANMQQQQQATGAAAGGAEAQQQAQQRVQEVENAMQQLKMNQDAERDRMKVEITREVEKEMEKKIYMMEAAHRKEIDEILSQQQQQSNGEDDEAREMAMRLQSEIDQLKQAHFAELENMANTHDDTMTQLRNELEARSSQLTQAHQNEIQKLTQDQKAASVADTLKFQEIAMDKLGEQHTQQMQSMVAQHIQQMEKLKQDLETKSAQDMEVKVADVTNMLGMQYKADIDKMAMQHGQEMQTLVQSELQKLVQQHAEEMEAVLADKRRLQQQAESVTRELQRDEQQGGTMTNHEKIEMVLKSFEGVYDPALLDQLRRDLKEQGEELNKQITQSNQQISSLQSRLDSNRGTEEQLTNEIKTLTQYKQSAEAELQRVRQGTADKVKEVLNLNNSIQSMTKDILDLQSQLNRLTQERDVGKKEIWELREWKKNAEAEREKLERDLKSKDGVIAKLKYDFNERNEDVNALVPEVARLQELTATLEALNAKSSNDFESLKQEAEHLKARYEKESKSAADMAQSLQGQLATEQSNNSKLMLKLQDDIKLKESEMSKLQSTASERTRTIADMRSKLESYRKGSETAIEESKKKIASMSADFERQLTRGNAAHKAELEQLKTKLQSDIQRLQQDLISRSNMITDLKTKLDASSTSNKKLSGEVVGFQTARRSTESLLKQSSHDLDAAKQEINRLMKRIEETQRFDASNIGKIKALESELAEKSAALDRLQSGATKFASEKERLLEDLNNLRQWKDSAQSSINALANEIGLNALSNEIAQTQEGKIDEVIEKLSGIRNELHRKDAELNYAKSSTDALLKGQSETIYSAGNMIETRSSPPPAGPSSSRTRSSYAIKPALPRVNVVGSGFSTRQKNVATARQSKFSSSPMGGGTEGTSTMVENASLPKEPTPPVVNTPLRPKSSNTMSAYDAALAASQQKEKATPDGVGQTAMSEASPAPMSGWAGYKHKQWGGYLDNLSPNDPTPQAQQNEYTANQYRKAEKQLLLEAKTLAQVAAKSFEEARALKGGQDKKKYDGILARANQERARVDEIFAEANVMKEKAEQGSMGP
eukprot:CAMPEP_0172308286 /NCGR_PEP_ID=MMETSP1058-20130122/8931_1 /TAXON_ID=83371 /ORGANISM="Detonula confervacea, Strain CCMP 353" /LENGTH=1927 /DNA_ID=CAMNT_0013020669 /DNA_START=215 /DNA_END=5998 /DNA_ORIENTATION=+